MLENGMIIQPILNWEPRLIDCCYMCEQPICEGDYALEFDKNDFICEECLSNKKEIIYDEYM